jgi:dolichol-phosphate mannosyltransferase
VEKISIIVPTYNEKSNIEELVKLIFSLGIANLEIIVVDDNSPDGTGDLIEGLKSKYQNLEIIHRTKQRGYGLSCIDGFRKAINEKVDLILTMDADFSHDPKYLSELIKNAEKFDVVIESRYIEGGGINNWNFFRRILSKFGNLYARFILNMPIHDLTGGFRCYQRRVLESIIFDDLTSINYSFLTEIIYRVYKNGFKIKEIPIIFTERKLGKSKFNFKIFFEAFIKVLTLRFKK